MKNIKLITIALFGALFLVLLANCLFASYPDEFDNILGGKLILEGILPYSGFFSHHGPLAYFLSAPLVLIGGGSFVKFRLLTSLVFLAYFVGIFLLFRKKMPKLDILAFWLFAFLTSFAAIYFWGHMFLADPMSGFFLVPAYLLLFYRMYFQEKVSLSDIVVISGFTFLSILNSMTYTYAGIVVYAILAIYYLRQIFLPFNKAKLKSEIKPLIIFGLVLVVPYLAFGLYLLVSGSINDFMYEAIGYNQKYYIYNYPRAAGVETINPIRYAIVIFNNFFNNFQLAVSGIISFNPRFPMTHALALANMVLFAWLLYRRKILLFFLVLGLLIFANARGNPAEIKVTDYQTSVYFILSILNFALVFDLLRKEINGISDHLAKSAFTILGIILAIYWVFAAIFIFSENWRITYNRYMGTAPLVYDRPIVAPIINGLVSPNEYCWAGPFEFEEMFYLKCKAPSKYHWILPQFAGIPLIKNQILSDYKNNSAKVIVFRRDYSAFGLSSEFNNFFVNFLDNNYTRLKGYHFNESKRGDFNLDDNFNFRKDVYPEMVKKLLEQGLISKN